MSWTLTILGVPLGHWTIRPSGTHDRYIITHFHIQKIIAWRELVAHLIKARNQLPDDKFKPGIESGQKFSQKKKTWACLVSQEQCLSFLCQSYAVIIIFQPAHSQSFSFASQVDNSPQSGFFVERFRWVLLTNLHAHTLSTGPWSWRFSLPSYYSYDHSGRANSDSTKKLSEICFPGFLH